MNFVQLKKLCEKAGISTLSLPTEDDERMQRYLQEITTNKSKIVVHEGRMERVVQTVIVILSEPLTPETEHRLFEMERKYPGGRTVKCMLKDGIGKKITPLQSSTEENLMNAAEQCLRVKLKFRKPPRLKSIGWDEVVSVDHSPLPCMFVRVIRHFFRGRIPRRLYNRYGYRRKQIDKYFSQFDWRPVPIHRTIAAKLC